MLQLEETGTSPSRIEMDILNSDAFFNLISVDHETLTEEEVALENKQSAEMGAERYLVKDGPQYVGILDFLMRNPKDGCPWLGLLQVDKKLQRQGYGSRMLETYIHVMKERKAERFRIGIIRENEPALRFWTRHGFEYVTTKLNDRGKTILIYEKTLSGQEV
ncbi:GNAT family N-acetyltransferase [Paenibacillus thailandensis]|uniref:GNAT family N-acetyltransferase n=1 Tax=Paenibacillus thailandensis TaxID=393250 RepID=A0ABW5QVQ2_9BACL